MTKSTTIIDLEFINAAIILRALTHNLRQLIMLEITSNGNRRTVTGIIKGLGMPQSVVSQHLAILRNAKLVIKQREAKNVYYSVDHKAIEQIKSACIQMAGNLV